MMNEDPTKIQLQSNVKKNKDPTIVTFGPGWATHGPTYIPEVTFVSQIEGNLWQGGCETGLQLPHFFKHILSLYPWERYRINHEMESQSYVKMYDSLEQSFEQIDILAQWVNECKKTGPILVHCQAGLNRSSLVVARSLMLEGRTAEESINLIRGKRSPASLCNPAFEEWLRTLNV